MNADEEMLNYISAKDGERKEKFKTFCQHFGLDQLLPIQQLFNIPKQQLQSNDQSSPKLSQRPPVDPETEYFIQYLVKKLGHEQTNRLKTEEQSAQVIEHMGMTIARLEMQRKESETIRSRSSSPMRRKVRQQASSYMSQRSAKNGQQNQLYE